MTPSQWDPVICILQMSKKQLQFQNTIGVSLIHEAFQCCQIFGISFITASLVVLVDTKATAAVQSIAEHKTNFSAELWCLVSSQKTSFYQHPIDTQIADVFIQASAYSEGQLHNQYRDHCKSKPTTQFEIFTKLSGLILINNCRRHAIEIQKDGPLHSHTSLTSLYHQWTQVLLNCGDIKL